MKMTILITRILMAIAADEDPQGLDYHEICAAVGGDKTAAVEAFDHLHKAGWIAQLCGSVAWYLCDAGLWWLQDRGVPVSTAALNLRARALLEDAR